MSTNLLDSWNAERVVIAHQETEWIRQTAAIFSMLNPKIGKDGNQWFCMYGSLPEPDCIVGFGDTPEGAVNKFIQAYYGR